MTEFQTLKPLLGRRADHPGILQVIGGDVNSIERREHLGFYSLRPIGLELAFKQAAWILPPGEVSNSEDLYLEAVHLHGSGHEGFGGYPSPLPMRARFGEMETELIAKLGKPSKSGGGHFSKLFNKTIERWSRYSLDGLEFSFQFGPSSRLELVTVSIPDETANRLSEGV